MTYDCREWPRRHDDAPSHDIPSVFSESNIDRSGNNLGEGNRWVQPALDSAE
jgi:hypothetical protein